MGVIEKQVLYKAIKDSSFGKGVFLDLPASTFNDGEKAVYSTLKKHYRTSSDVLNEAELLQKVETDLVNRNAKEEKVTEALDTAQEVYDVSDTAGTEEYFSDTFNKSIDSFVKKVLSMDLIKKTLLDNGALDDDDKMVNMANELTNIRLMDTTGSDSSLTFHLKDREKRLQEYADLYKNKLSTGFKQLDDISGGGLAKGEVGLIMGSTGGGKSSFATQIVVNYIKNGKNVLYLSLEEGSAQVGLKMDTVLTGKGKNFFIDPTTKQVKTENMEAVSKAYESMSLWGELIISAHLPQEIGVTDLDRIISDLTIRQGVTVDVVVIDYPELLINPHERYVGTSEAGGKLYEDIRALAGKHKFICWTLSQLNRTGANEEVKTGFSIEGSKRKMNAVELALVINQKPVEYQHSVIRLYREKARYISRRTDGSDDKMSYFKFNVESQNIVEETEAEIMAHRALLEQPEGKGRGNNKPDAVDRVDAINQNLYGGAN